MAKILPLPSADQSTQHAERLAEPHNLEAEEYVLGAMMLSGRAIDDVTELIAAVDFYRDSHRHIYKAICELHGEGSIVDPLTVSHRLEQHQQLDGLGGKDRIREIASLAPAAANAAHHAGIVLEMAQLRRMQNVGQDLVRLAIERPGTTTELLDQAEQKVFELGESRHDSELEHFSVTMTESWARMEMMHKTGPALIGTPTGFKSLDELTMGLQRGNMIVLAARPSMGKSALALCMACHLTCNEGIPVAMFSLEMSKAEVADRMVSIRSMVDLSMIRSGKFDALDWPRLQDASNLLRKAPLWVNDAGAPTVMEMRSKLRRAKTRHPDLGLVIVDYLQLMAGHKEIYERVTENSRALKVMARDLDVPILVLCQLNRNLEQRPDRRPVLSDLRDSGAVEQDADVVMFVYRDEVYHPETEEAGVAEIIVAKHRNGPIGMRKLGFMGKRARFAELAG